MTEKYQIEFLKSLVPDVPDSELEVAHKVSRHRGGNDETSNMLALTKIEHAFQHLQDAKHEKDWKTSQKDYAALRLIVSRMTDSERKVFNYFINHTK